MFIRFAFLLFSILAFQISRAESIKVMTFNTWGVPLTVWDQWRYSLAMADIEKINPDIVVLTEVFTAKGKRDFLSARYPYVADGPGFLPRAVGSGIRVLSKFPFTEHAILTYQNCKSADCLSRKGAALVTVVLPSGKKVNIVGTHLNAAGGPDVRKDQLNQLAVFSDFYADPAAATLLVGDFNFGPKSVEYAYAKTLMGVQDAWSDTHDSAQNILQNPLGHSIDLGHTYDCFNNHYAHDYAVKTRVGLFSDRIDFLFFRGAIQATQTTLHLNDAWSLFSDHYALMGEFII